MAEDPRILEARPAPPCSGPVRDARGSQKHRALGLGDPAGREANVRIPFRLAWSFLAAASFVQAQKGNAGQVGT